MAVQKEEEELVDAKDVHDADDDEKEDDGDKDQGDNAPARDGDVTVGDVPVVDDDVHHQHEMSRASSSSLRI